MKKKVMIVTGTRPQIIKSAPIIHKLMERFDEVDLDFVHTGQHYDDNLFKNFIEEFDIIEPTDLYVSGDAVYLVANIMIELEKHICKNGKPDIMLVPGDTNSALAAGLTAMKMDIPFGHIEAGVREWDLVMHEEMNRRILDHSASILFIPTESGYKHLISEKVQGRLCLVGDTNYDLYLERSKNYNKSERRNGIVLTTHRRENVYNEQRLRNILLSVNDLGILVRFPVHPNTMKQIKKLKLPKLTNIHFMDPVGYDDMMDIISVSPLVITDSGGLQKEAFFANIPCVTLRDVTAWDETVLHGGNKLCGADDRDLMYNTYVKMYAKKLDNPKVYGGGNASGQIVDIILNSEIKIPNKRVGINGR